MSAEIIPLGAASVVSDRKAEFVQHLSASFDAYVAETGLEPEACVHILASVTERCSVGWHMTGEAEGRADAVLCRSEKALLRQIMKGD